MSISQFRAGKLVQRFQYRSFEPELIDIKWHLDSDSVAILLSQADQKLGELNAFYQWIQ